LSCVSLQIYKHTLTITTIMLNGRTYLKLLTLTIYNKSEITFSAHPTSAVLYSWKTFQLSICCQEQNLILFQITADIMCLPH